MVNIVRHPETCGGEPRIEGTRITCRHLWLLFMRQHLTVTELVREYPHLTREQVEAALKYAFAHPECRYEDEEEYL